ncbi:MAG: response regulator [Bryobacteraceae bacterium]
MSAAPILIVDDTPVNLKLTRILLESEGYEAVTAGTAEEALDLLGSFHPQLILTDLQLPGMDGLELVRRVKRDPALRDIVIVALTAYAMAGDERKALDAGCDGYITKPINTRTLGDRLRGYLENRVAAPAPPANCPQAGVPESEILDLRRRFLAEGQEKSRQMLIAMDGSFSAGDAAKTAHQWIGAAGLLGYDAIAHLCRDVEGALLEKPLDNGQLRENLANLATAFSTPPEALDSPVPEYVTQTLSGKRVALVGLPANEGARLGVALDRVEAVPTFFDVAEPPILKRLLGCDLAVIHVRAETANSPWLDPAKPYLGARPVVLAGSRDQLLELDRNVQSVAREVLMDASWQTDEALVRLSLALQRRRPAGRVEDGAGFVPAGAPGRPCVLVAGGEPAVLETVRAALQNFGMTCTTADSGPAALEAIRTLRPHAAVLDADMPGMDGYEVLAAVRSAQVPVHVMVLTVRQRESDFIRGFNLGAGDYMTKPFSTMELVARLNRLLGRCATGAAPLRALAQPA